MLLSGYAVTVGMGRIVGEMIVGVMIVGETIVGEMMVEIIVGVMIGTGVAAVTSLQHFTPVVH